MSDDIVKALRDAAVVVSDRLGEEWKPLGWTLCDAAAEIERLRSIAGKADVGPSFTDMTSELRHMTASE